jgi:hypothetical protein
MSRGDNRRHRRDHAKSPESENPKPLSRIHADARGLEEDLATDDTDDTDNPDHGDYVAIPRDPGDFLVRIARIDELVHVLM